MGREDLIQFGVRRGGKVETVWASPEVMIIQIMTALDMITLKKIIQILLNAYFS